MALTEQDKIQCGVIAGQIIKEVLTDHVNNCPHHQAYLISRAKLMGVAVGVVVASGVTSGTAATIILKLFGG